MAKPQLSAHNDPAQSPGTSHSPPKIPPLKCRGGGHTPRNPTDSLRIPQLKPSLPQWALLLQRGRFKVNVSLPLRLYMKESRNAFEALAGWGGWGLPGGMERKSRLAEGGGPAWEQ